MFSKVWNSDHFILHEHQHSVSQWPQIDVNGPNMHPVYRFLREQLPEQEGGGGGKSGELGKDIGWNFFKFLVDRKGRPVKRFYQVRLKSYVCYQTKHAA